MVTILMAIGFIMMKNVPIGRVVLVIVWFFHFLYFGLKIETVKEEKESIPQLLMTHFEVR